jgi:glycosyltransferase involved in cell wall biosynthesis
MPAPFVSIIIPTYNRGDTLRSAVNSVLGQTYKNFELIVVDDFSEESAAKSLEGAGITDPRLKILRHEYNQGQAAARNTGAKNAQGQWLAFLDDDDRFLRRKLSRQLAYMRKRKLNVSVTDFTLPGDLHLYNLLRNSGQNPTWLITTGRFLALPSTMMITKSLFNQVGGFDQDPRVRRTEDLDFALRLHQHGQTLAIMPEFLSHYSGFHPASPMLELSALEAIEQKHRYTFPMQSKAAARFRVAMDWKKAHFTLTGKPLTVRIIKFASLACQHPLRVTGLVASVLQNPFYLLFPPVDRPKTGMPSNKGLSHPCIPL